MPVRKYRSIEEMNQRSEWLPAGHPGIVRRMRLLWRMTTAVAPLQFPRGVRKYRSIEEANADRDRWEHERIERIRAERLRK